jgi:tetratricopeptide (TPR) repeat protein
MKRLIFYFLVSALTAGLVTGCSENGPKQKIPAVTTLDPALTPDTDIKVRSYQTLLKQDPGNLQALIGLGNAYMDSGLYPQAVTYYQKALQIQPQNVNVRVDMGTCYRRVGNPQKAIEEYKKALTYEPDHFNALTNMGVVLAYDLNDVKSALEAWEKATSLHPNHPQAGPFRQEIAKIKSQKH